MRASLLPVVKGVVQGGGWAGEKEKWVARSSKNGRGEENVGMATRRELTAELIQIGTSVKFRKPRTKRGASE